ncbi:inositol polyphosphate-4-phosphatase type I A-like [Actinia tenebrosa]|uniref:phosphatidylinositol-3,4-bisphosphate 4-phosphatase n=1 Tax=Actinia tenebrosa TaxID=6105 RepID=A0A6P8J1P2_ACTTE|nr:inositol polyphosphate-4-phosphatase type I A-like [Actinia tenebrosa]
MRFNQRELANIATNNDVPFDKEGILWLKEKEGYFWSKNEVYSERLFRLRGNILFYFKTKDKTSEPAGAIVLERCKVQKRQPTIKHAFTIVFDEDDTQLYHLKGKSTKDTEDWIEKIRSASYESLRNKLLSLRRQLMDITGKDPLPEYHPLAVQEPLKPGIGQYSSTSTASNSDETPLLEMCIACNGLVSPIEGRSTNAFVEIRTMTPPSTTWIKHAQTEIIEQKQDPFFLTTVVFPSNGTIQDVTRLKLAVFDVRDREKEEMSILGHAVCTIRDITSAPDQKLYLTLTGLDSSASCGTIIVLGWQAEQNVKTRSSSLDSSEGVEGPTGRRNTGKAMILVDQILTRSYRFPTRKQGKDLKVLELMGESMLTFKIPIQLLKIYIAEEHQRALELHHLGDLNPDWENSRHEIIDNHFKLIFAYKGQLRDLMALKGNSFKPSKLKAHKQLAFVPVNLHLQRLRVNDGCNPGKVYEIVTVGAPVCHTLKFGQGGLKKMMSNLKRIQQSGPESDGKSAVLKQSRANLERLKQLISQLCDRLKQCMKSLNVQHILETLNALSDKGNQLLKLREAPLVTESLSSLEKVVPRPKEDEQVAESSEWQWNVTAFSRDKAQELSKLVQQTLIIMQTHINGLLLGEKPPSGQKWNDVIMGEIHDFSRAADGLAKEIYLGLVFAQLQEDSRHIALRYTIKRRHDIVFSHAVTALIAGFISKLYTNLDNPSFWKQIIHIGFLAQFESLLSTNGDEMGMLEDMCVGVQSLTRVKLKIVQCERDDEIPALSGNRSCIQVSIPVPAESFQLLPKEVQEAKSIRVTPVLFTQGVNEHATLAEKFGDTSLQESINGDNYSILSFYVQQFKDLFPELCGSRFPDDTSIDNLMEQLKVNVEGRKSKNVDILLLSEQLCWRMNGGRFTSCKSAKDRTAMAVTLEQAMTLQREHSMNSEVLQQSLDAMRSEGTRIENAYKNTGFRKYAFNYWQVMALPRLYRPPPGTYGKNVQT